MPADDGPGAPGAAACRHRKRLIRLLPVLAVVAATGAWAGGIFGLAGQMLAMRALGPDDFGGRLDFGTYRVRIEGEPIEGLSENTSGLTYSPATGTLFTTINDPPELAELSTDGRLLRRIALRGARDVEGITHVEGDRFIIVDEGKSRLNWITITPETQAIDLLGTPFVVLDLVTLSNLGFEGISWDQRRQELVVVQEMLPVRVLVVSGLEQAVQGQGLGIALREWQPEGWAGHGLSDLSSVTVHDPTGNMILLSQMSSLLIEYDAEGAPLSLLSLWAGRHGLRSGVPQAEGVAIGPAGEVFIVSEPNLFYAFERSRLVRSPVGEASPSRLDGT
jgi:uncharacterized protein YjiK